MVDGGAGNRTRVREALPLSLYVRIRGSSLTDGQAPRRPVVSQPLSAFAISSLQPAACCRDQPELSAFPAPPRAGNSGNGQR